MTDAVAREHTITELYIGSIKLSVKGKRNSKSTFLLIVDFVFGGSTYSHAEDILNNIGPYDIFFTFKFGEGEH